MPGMYINPNPTGFVRGSTHTRRRHHPGFGGLGTVAMPAYLKDATFRSWYARKYGTPRPTGFGGAVDVVNDLAAGYKQYLVQKGAIDTAKAQAKQAAAVAKQAQAEAALAAQRANTKEADLTGGSFLDSIMATISSLPMPVLIGGTAALGYLGYQLIGGRRSRRR